MQLDVQAGGGAEALDEGDGTRGGRAVFDARLLDQMRRNHPVNDLQYRVSNPTMPRSQLLLLAASAVARAISSMK